MPKPFPAEFRRDVIAVARKGEAPIAQVAKDFGISESCLHRWLKIADLEDGCPRRSGDRGGGEMRRGAARAAEAEQAAGAGERDPAPGGGLLRPRRPPKMMYPLVRELAADGIPVAVTCRVLGFSKQAFYKWQANPVTQRDWDDAHLINAASTSTPTTPTSATGSSPTNCRPGHHRRREPGRPAVLASSGSGRCSPRSGA